MKRILAKLKKSIFVRHFFIIAVGVLFVFGMLNRGPITFWVDASENQLASMFNLICLALLFDFIKRAAIDGRAAHAQKSRFDHRQLHKRQKLNPYITGSAGYNASNIGTRRY